MDVLKHHQKLVYELYEYLKQILMIKDKNEHAYWAESLSQEK